MKAFLLGLFACEPAPDEQDSVRCTATFYRDADADGYGAADDARTACDAPNGYVADASDCDDGDSDVHPKATERCDGRDEDCDAIIDEDAVDAPTWYTDADADGYGDAHHARAACTAPSGTVADASDCDDGSSAVFPSAEETCDGLDDDCDLEIDEGLAVDVWHADADGDGYGDPTSSVIACAQPVGFIDEETDCDDRFARVHPGATESDVDGLDDDCDGVLSVVTTDDLSLWRAKGEEAGALGVSVVADGDLTGDGVPDLALGGQLVTVDDAPHGGAVLLFAGPLAPTDEPVDATSAAAAVLYGDPYDGYARVCSVGDLDADGAADLVVGAPWGGMHGEGAAYVTYGPFDGTIDLRADAAAFVGDEWWTWLGQCAGPGDVDGDGVPDVVIAASGASEGGTEWGAVYVASGSDATASLEDARQRIVGSSDYEGVGGSALALGDLDGDGASDFGVTASTSSDSDLWRAYLVLDHDAGVFAPADVAVAARYAESGDPRRFVMAEVGDVDEDGHPDVGFADEGFMDSSQLVIVLGPFGADEEIQVTAGADIKMSSSAGGAYRWFAFAAPVEDWNGDGHGALAIADPGLTKRSVAASLGCAEYDSRCSQGGIYIVDEPIDAGVHDLANEADRIEGTQGSGYLGGGGFGPALAGGSDLDGDGFTDLAFAAWAATFTSTQQGEAFVLSGPGGL